MSLRQLCKSKGLNLSELAEKIGSTNDYLSKLNTGKRKNPSFEMGLKIAKVLGVTPEEVQRALGS